MEVGSGAFCALLTATLVCEALWCENGTSKKVFFRLFFLRWLAIKEGCSSFVRGEDLRRVFVDFFLLRVVGSAR